MNTYQAIANQFPASTEVWQEGELVNVRIAGEARMSVLADMEAIGKAAGEGFLVRFYGPYLYGSGEAGRWVCHGEIRENRKRKDESWAATTDP